MMAGSSDDEAIAVSIFNTILKRRIRGKQQKRKKRTAWVKPWLQRRTQYGAFESLVQELRREDEGEYNNYFRMNTNEFDEILNLFLVHTGITKKDTNMRQVIPPATKLAVTLRFLASGESYQSLQ